MERCVKIRLKELVGSRDIYLRELARLSDIEPSIINKRLCCKVYMITILKYNFN